METLLELKNVSKIFRLGIFGRQLIRAVDNVSIHVDKGEILGILGESGSGKSTIAKLILKLIKPSKGQILFKGRDVWSIEDKDYYKAVQGIFQDPFASFNPRRRVIDVFKDVARNYYANMELNSPDKLAELLAPVLEKVGINLKDVIGRYPHEFSGGQLQRLSIARALLVKPELLIADEPVSMVDASTRIDILNIFIDLKERESLTSVIIGHDLSLTSYVSDRVVVLYRGQVVEEGPVDILHDPYHPYTKMLSEAVPRISERWSKPISYGTEYNGKSSEKGCVFASRCQRRMEICNSKEPPVVDLGSVKVKCWLYTSR